MPTTPPAITLLPTPPDPNNRATFNALAYPWSVAQQTLATQVGAVAANVKANADETVLAADIATAQAAAAAGSASLAGAVAWVSGATYAIGDARYSLVDFQTYRRRTAGAGTTDPSLDATNWAPTSFAAIRTPVNVTPAGSATGVAGTPTLTASAYYSLYGVTMAAAQWQVSTVSNFSSSVVNTGDVAGAAVQYLIPAAILSVSTGYFWRVRYKDADGIYSAWSTATSFTTAAAFTDYIPTPTATPSAIGDALEGGFYAGMIWNEVLQSSTSTAIGTGSKTFTVPSMSTTPVVYSGQALEVRSRANPANKMLGTVIDASGTTLTLNITSVEGSGTFTDWSVMAKFRIIVAPKSSGENAGIAIKNANTALPSAAITLTEGRKATLAMVAADTSTVYPAAHWANNLRIGGYADWHIPARDALELCWRNLKPTTENNYDSANRPTGASASYANLGSYGDTANTHGLNNNSSPTGAAYTTSVPGQTAATAFRTGGSEAFEYGSANYWSASEYSAPGAWVQYWGSSNPGYQYGNGKTDANRVRAVRQSII